MRKLTSLLAIGLVAAGLTACSVSDQERQSCESSGGTVQSDRFHFKGEGFWSTNTGTLDYCEVEGEIVTVYNDEIMGVDRGFFGDSGDNQEVFEKCTAKEGRVYETYSSKKHKWVCVQGGQVVQILS